MVRKRNGRQHPAIYISAIAYADDICLLAESIDDVECSLHRLETSAAEIGLTVNHNKTKAMHLEQASVRHVRFANGNPVDSCDKFKHLGVPTSNAETVFQSPLSKAQSSTLKRMTLLKLVSADQLLIHTVVWTRMSPLTSTLQNKLGSAYRRILRYGLGVHLADSNAEVTRMTGVTALSNTLIQ